MSPDPNTEYLLYQTLVAIWPAQRPGRRVDDLPDRAWRDAARERLTRYMLKAAREAKLRTSWTDPDAAYEAALTSFVRAMLEPADDAPFLSDVARLVAHIAADRGSPIRSRASPFTSRRQERPTSIRATSSGISRSSIRTTAGQIDYDVRAASVGPAGGCRATPAQLAGRTDWT